MNSAALRIYEYKHCGTCKKAIQYLDCTGIAYERIPIREQPPTLRELQRMLQYLDGNLRKLFNTSGRDYKALGLSATLPTMSDADALALLASNGNLVKRPFVLTRDTGWVGFDEAVWKTQLTNELTYG